MGRPHGKGRHRHGVNISENKRTTVVERCTAETKGRMGCVLLERRSTDYRIHRTQKREVKKHEGQHRVATRSTRQRKMERSSTNIKERKQSSRKPRKNSSTFSECKRASVEQKFLIGSLCEAKRNAGTHAEMFLHHSEPVFKREHRQEEATAKL